MLVPGMVLADSIDPASYSDSLDVGESVTVRKTVTVTEEATSSVVDVMFVFDITGSMGGEISAAKSSANDILSSLGGLGNLQSGSGWYGDPLHDGTHVDLNATNTGDSSGINDMWDSGSCTVAGASGGCGGDFPEVGYAALYETATETSWRPGSNRFIVTFGDASFKTGPDGTDNASSVQTALTDNNVNLLGISYDSAFTTSLEGIGGTAFAAGSTTDLVGAISSLVTGSLFDYSEVTVDDLGAGMPGVGVSVACVSADIGTCSGDTATGVYDRTTERTFEFDVTFTGMAEGTHSFDTHALVDGGIVATEADRFIVGEGSVSVPEPSSVALLGTALLSLVGFRRRKCRRS
ncbi:PEP-CTERM sorting domain-containing protein [Marinimicrobium sp. C2-29]|uniref:PEP-CTERM sorting domain-containing protein n=1 Tax=Marinimicrobium sp. C2-29 TaxID=3139825 RepID=UPI003139EF1A